MSARALLFAYGSLLSEGVMLNRAPTARRSDPAVLEDWRVTFRRGVADVTPAPGRRVLGGLWLIAPEDFDSLDVYEGISGGFYSRYRLPVRTAAGEEQWPFAYVMPPDDSQRGLPYDDYLETVRAGLREWGWDSDELDRAVREGSWAARRAAAVIQEGN